jgi:hypothetical protein
VLLVGVVVVALVLILNLIPRLSNGQKLLDHARPAFSPARVAGDRAGINMVSSIVDLADPIVNVQGGAAAEVPKLVAFVSAKTGLTPAAVVSALQKGFPHTAALLQALPLSAVNTEIPGLVAFLAKALKTTPAGVLAALNTNFPHLSQTINALPAVVNGWDSIPGTTGLTRFNGTPVKTVPDLRTYFSADVIPVLETQRANFATLDGTSKINWIPLVVLAIGIVAILFAIAMILRARGTVSRTEGVLAGAVVVVVGIVVVGLVLVVHLIPRLTDGQKVLDHARPAFAAARVTGDRAGINMVSSIVDLADPIVTPQGGGAAEVPKLVAFVSAKTGLAPAAVLAALHKNFPHTTALLEAIPLASVNTEIAGLVSFLANALKTTPAGIVTALNTSFPRLSQTINALPKVVGGWETVPGTANLTRFNGTPVRTVPDVRTYFSADVVPVLQTQRTNFASLDGTSKIDWIAPLVLIVGIVVILYGLLMVLLARRRT